MTSKASETINNAQSSYGIFSAKLKSVQPFVSLLKAAAFADKANILINEHGIKFVFEEGKYIQSTVITTKEMYLDFRVEEESIAFRVPSKELMELLKTFPQGESSDSGNHTTFAGLGITELRLAYRGFGASLHLTFEEDGMKTEMHLRTEDPDELMEFEENDDAHRVILKSDPFQECMESLDTNQAEIAKVTLDPSVDVMVVGADATSGHQAVLIPRHAPMVEVFALVKDIGKTVSNFKFSVLKYAFKGLTLCPEVKLKLCTRGLLTFSYMLPNRNDCYLNFLCLPLIDE